VPRMIQVLLPGVLLACLVLLSGPRTASAVDGSAGPSRPDATQQGPALPELRFPWLAQKAEAESENDEQPKERQSEETTEPTKQPADTAEKASSEADDSAKPQEQSAPPLNQEMIALRDQVRRVLAFCFNRSLNTHNNTPAEILGVCLAFGCDSEVRQGGPSGAKINAVTCLCWNYPCAGYKLLRVTEDGIAARAGYGVEAHAGQFLAVLGQSRVPADYPIRVGEDVRTVADLVETEKRSCRSGINLSFKLIGLSHYVKDDQTWRNRTGQEWSVQRLIREELARGVDNAEASCTQRLMGLSYAVNRRIKRKQTMTGQFRRAQTHVADCQKYALGLQNPEGSWHPRFFALRGTAGPTLKQLRSTGYMLEWLVFSLPKDQLEDPRIVKSVAYLTSLLGNRWDPGSMSTRQLEGLMHATHALAIYDRRVFKPHDSKKPASGENEAAEQHAAL